MAGGTSDDIPDPSGKTVLVPGGNPGLGYQTVLPLARKGARVLLAARDRARGTAALERLGAEAPGSQAELAQIDLADLTSVERFAAGFLAGGEGLDLLISNAGVMAIPQRETTAQGYERQFGTNHLGHFALTGRLLPALAQRPGSRVVTVSSNQHKRAKRIDFDDLQAEHGYRPWGAYAQSKLANAMFVLELDRRLRPPGLDLVSAGPPPGVPHPNLHITGPPPGGPHPTAHPLGPAAPAVAHPPPAPALSSRGPPIGGQVPGAAEKRAGRAAPRLGRRGGDDTVGAAPDPRPRPRAADGGDRRGGVGALPVAVQERSQQRVQSRIDPVQPLVGEQVVDHLAGHQALVGEQLADHRLELAPGLRVGEAAQVAGVDLRAEAGWRDQGEGRDPPRVPGRGGGRGGAAQRVTDQVGALGADRVQYPEDGAGQRADRPVADVLGRRAVPGQVERVHAVPRGHRLLQEQPGVAVAAVAVEDRKSTRLNSSHSQISYAVFCLKKKKKNK